MSETVGQISFGGETVSGVKFLMGGLSLENLPDGLTWDQVADLRYKDRLQVTVTLLLDSVPGAKGKFDRSGGDEIGPLTGIFSFIPLREGFKVTGIQTAAAREEAWQREHGAA